MKTDMYFSTLISTMLLEFLYHPHFMCDRIFLKCSFSECSLSRYKCVLNMAEALCSITDSQTVQAQTSTDTLGQETKFCLRNTALFVVCRTAM